LTRATIGYQQVFKKPQDLGSVPECKPTTPLQSQNCAPWRRHTPFGNFWRTLIVTNQLQRVVQMPITHATGCTWIMVCDDVVMKSGNIIKSIQQDLLKENFSQKTIRHLKQNMLAEYVAY